jgi:hypothetical protein
MLNRTATVRGRPIAADRSSVLGPRPDRRGAGVVGDKLGLASLVGDRRQDRTARAARRPAEALRSCAGAPRSAIEVGLDRLRED